VQCATLDTASLFVSAIWTAEAVTAPTNLFEKSGAGFIGGVFPGLFETTDYFLFNFYFLHNINGLCRMLCNFQCRCPELSAEAY